MIGVPLDTAKAIRSEFEKKLSGYSVVMKDINELDRIYIIEDSHVV